MTRPEPPEPRIRKRALYAAVFAIQTALYAVTVGALWGHWLEGDGVLYEIPAWNLAQGHGLSYGRHQWEDPSLTELYHAAHPEAAGTPWVPAVTLPPGYSFLLAGVYAVIGRSLLAAVLVNWVLLIATLAAMLILVERVSGESWQPRVALLLIAVFPDWAFWAGHVMSDTLHVLLVTLFCVVFFREGPHSDRRAFAGGVILGLASLVRPYALLLPPALALGWLVLRRPAFRLRGFIVLALVTWAVVGAWTARNYYYFERFIPVTSMQLGDSMWMGTYEVGVSQEQADAAFRSLKGLHEEGNIHHLTGNRHLRSVALSRIRAAPLDYALACALRVPKLWTALAWGPATLPVRYLHERGRETSARVTKLAFAAAYVMLFAAMLLEMVRQRGTTDPILVGGLVLIVYYTLVFVPLHTEARYTLPARFFGLLFAAPAVARLWHRVRGRRPFPFVPGR